MNELLKAGEFAALCRTTKETLRHYDRIGLLRPAVRAENGYKMYALMQTVDFSLISALQSTGLALAEIRSFVTDPGTQNLSDLLAERIDAIEAQRIDLARKQQTLEDALAQMIELDSWLGDEAERNGVHRAANGCRWRIVECAEERFVETAIPYSEEHEDEFLASAAEHMDYCKQHELGSGFQEAYRYDEQHVQKHEYGEGMHALMSVADDVVVQPERLRVKPAGTYLQWLYAIDLTPLAARADGGDGESDGSAKKAERAPEREKSGGAKEDTEGEEDANPLFDAYDAMLALAKEQNLRVTGDLYDTVLSSYTGRLTAAIYTCASIRILPFKD